MLAPIEPEEGFTFRVRRYFERGLRKKIPEKKGCFAMKNPVERLTERLIHGDSQKAALVFSEKNRRYFTQFPATDGALLVTAEKPTC